MSVARRRYLVYYLLELDVDIVEFEAAVNAVYEYEAAGAGDDYPSRETVRIDLHHVQLPWLVEAGILEYDRRQGTIRFRGDPVLEECVDYARRKELDRN